MFEFWKPSFENYGPIDLETISTNGHIPCSALYPPSDLDSYEFEEWEPTGEAGRLWREMEAERTLLFIPGDKYRGLPLPEHLVDPTI